MVGIAAKATEDRAITGISMMLVAYLLFSFIDTGAKYLSILGFASIQLAFMRYFGHFAISFSIVSSGGLTLDRFATEKFGLVVLRGFLLMMSTVLNFIAVRYIPLTLTSTILFSAPLIICALSGPMLGERVGVWRWGAILVGFAGILIAIRPFDETFHWAAFLSLTAAASFALYSLLTRKLAGIVAADTLQFYSGAIGTFVLLPFAIWQWQSPTNPLDWTIMIGLGVCGWAGHELLTRAHRYATAATLTPYGYTFIIYLTIWSFLLFDHLPDVWIVVGAAIIIAAGIFIWKRERQLNADKLRAEEVAKR